MKQLAAILSAALLSGCVSSVAHFGANCWGEPYVGARLAYYHAASAPLLLLDLPFDAVLDTALLPADLAVAVFADGEGGR